MALLDNLIRPNIRNLSPYTSAREQFMDYGLTLLDANENPLGSVGLKDNPWHLNRYPDPYQRDIKDRLAALKEHPAAGIVLGNGSDEIIDLLIRIFCEPATDEILITAPTYAMYKVAAHINNVGVSEVSLGPNFDLDGQAMLDKVQDHTKIIFLCSPNNPTANSLSLKEMELVFNQFQGIVVVDEAYIEFADQATLITRCQEFPRLVVMQTFSKAWGLAGIRLGVCYASLEIAHYLNMVKPPYNVNQLTQQQALLALKSAQSLSGTVQQILQERGRLKEMLEGSPMVEAVHPSQTNFLLVRVKQPNEIFKYLIDNQVIVRNRSNVHLCHGCLRITVGSAAENQQLMDALNAFEL